MANPNVFQYKSFSSFVHPSFWHKLAELKIDVDRLNDSRKEINGFFTNSDATHCLLEVDCTAFNQEFEGQAFKFQCHGAIINKNKIEDFKICDKLTLINDEGKIIWDDIASGRCLEQPSLLARFVVLSFADLKSFNYYYWFAYPCPTEPIIEKYKAHKLIVEEFNATQLQELTQLYFQLCNENRTFFILKRGPSDDQFTYFKLIDKINVNSKETNFSNEDLANIYFCFSDPCPNAEYAGWPLRLFLLMLTHLCPQLRDRNIKILSVRVKKAVSLENSVSFSVQLPSKDVDVNAFKWIGWEPNNQGKYLPRNASMASSMDPQKLAESGVYLNLKLMKWRLLPDLDLKKIATTKCLLFGSGTLGCSVARNLVAWGIRHITLIDSGHVSFSNPVRQSLFLYDDAVHRREKATTAVARLQEICPGITTAGYKLHIPMPGFTVGESIKEKTTATIKEIERLVEQHDAIFLLTDSRESRWLPTLLGAANNKIVINSALGFDSYLIMRHGGNPSESDSGETCSIIDGLKCIKGDQLGCYFCNDITAPGDSQKDRTLDQQCTVTRPAVANIAGSLAAELLISLIEHPQKILCPAYISLTNADVNATAKSIPEGILGIVPHSIRGMICNFEQILPATERFSQCIACSKKIIDEYKKNGHEFLFRVFESSKYLEDLSGISDLLNAQHDEILEFDCDSDIDISD